MKPHELTEAIIEEAMCGTEPSHYQDFGDFARDCHSVSLALVRSGLLGKGGRRLRVARGACRGVGGQHSWVTLGSPYDPTSTIVDLTLWSYDPTAARIHVQDGMGDRYRPHGFGFIFDSEKPHSRGGEPMPLAMDRLSPQARQFLHIIGPLDAPGWAALWSRTGMLGWPSGEIMAAFIEQYPAMRSFIPIDLVGMLTDTNPESLYW